MSNSPTPAHTPAPWRFDGDWHRIPAIFGADGKHVASVEKDAREATPERAANAALIAAAPDLLRVAELLVDWLDEEEGAHKLCDTARAAIALAKGAA